MKNYKDEFVTGLSLYTIDERGRRIWRCRCRCGNMLIRKEFSIKSKKHAYCRKCPASVKRSYDKIRKHNLSSHPLYKVWGSMKQRCYNSRNKFFKTYGKKGIRVCDAWKEDFLTFHNWCIDNGWKKGLLLDRIDSDGDYDPKNCQFISLRENALKVRRDRPLSVDGSNHWKSKLDENKVLDIKKRLLDGERPVDIALDYPGSIKSIYQIKENRTWKHVKVHSGELCRIL